MVLQSRACLMGLAMIAVLGFVPTTQAETLRSAQSKAYLTLLLSRQKEVVTASLLRQDNVTATRLNRLEQRPKTPPVVRQINQLKQQQTRLLLQLSRQQVALQGLEALLNARLAALQGFVPVNRGQLRTIQALERQLSGTMTAIANQIVMIERAPGTPVR